MKKLIFAVLTAFIGLSANAQTSNVGASFGLPTSNKGNFYDFSTTLDWNLLWEINEIVDVGGGIGLIYLSGSSLSSINNGEISQTDVYNVFMPVTANFRWKMSKKFTFGLDVGYAFSFRPSFTKGGFYSAQKLQYSINDKLSLVFSNRLIYLNDSNIRSFSTNFSRFQSLNLGVEFKL